MACPIFRIAKASARGELSFFLPVLTLAGKNGLNFELSLTYNSAVRAVVEDKFMTSTGSETLPDNAKMQMSEVGLGWSLNLPKIVWGTYFYPPIPQNLNFITSDAYLVSEGGSNKLIDLGNNDYGLKRHDYSKIHYNGGTGEWTITDRSGVTYTFAQVQTTYDWKYSVLYPNFDYAKHSMAWFLTKIQDVFGNQIDLEYETDDITLSAQYYECIVSGPCDWKSWSSPDNYVKATRVTKITDSQGRVIKSNYASDRQDTPSINQQDPPYKFAIHYSDKRLDYIEVWDKDPGGPGATKIHYIQFEHDYLTIGAKKKLLLESIQFRDPADPANDSKAQPATKFTYKNTSGVKGPLETVTMPNGGVTTYDFDTKSYQGSVIDYKMLSKTVDDGISASPSTITYSYGTVTEITENGFKYYMFPDITETGPTTTAKVINYYDVSNQNRIGTIEKTEYKNNTALIQSIEYDWEAIQVFASKDAYDTRITQTIASRDGAPSLITENYYDNLNGLANQIKEHSFSGDHRWKDIIYAFRKYTGMNASNEHMLSQVAQLAIYEYSIDANNYNARSSAVTTWKDWGSDSWAPEETYSWQENDATLQMPDFNFTTPPGDDEWILASKIIDRDDNNGQITETQDGNSVSSTTIWGYDSSLPIGTVSNAAQANAFVPVFEDEETTGWTGDNTGWSMQNGMYVQTSNTTTAS